MIRIEKSVVNLLILTALLFALAGDAERRREPRFATLWATLFPSMNCRC